MTGKSYRPLFTKMPTDRESRWRLVKEFIDTWYRPLQREDGYSENELQTFESQLGFRFPASLREWWLLAGKRKEVWSSQDHLLGPNEVVQRRTDTHPYFRKFDGTIVIYSENQGCESWVIRDCDLAIQDPPVYRITEDPREVTSTITAFAIQTLFREVIWHGPMRGWGGDFSPSAMENVRRRFTRCDLPELFWSALEPVRFFEAQDIAMYTHVDSWIYVAALNEEACEIIPKVTRDAMEWDTFP